MIRVQDARPPWFLAFRSENLHQGFVFTLNKRGTEALPCSSEECLHLVLAPVLFEFLAVFTHEVGQLKHGAENGRHTPLKIVDASGNGICFRQELICLAELFFFRELRDFVGQGCVADCIFHIVGPNSWRHGIFACVQVVVKRESAFFLVTRAGFCAVLGNDMANTPVISPESWEALKAASIRGVPDSQLAESFGVERNAIRQRRFLDPIWKAAYSANMELVNSAGKVKEAERGDNAEKLTGNLTDGAGTASLAKKVASTISDNVTQLSDSNLLLASQIARKGLQRASGEIEALPIENIADIERIFKMAAIAGKWNQPQVQVNQAFAFGGGQDDGAIVECETEIVEDAGNYGDAFNLEE